MKTKQLYILLFFTIVKINAQNIGDNTLGTWFEVTSSNKISDKFTINGALTNWNFKILDNQHLLLGTIGLNYTINKAVTIGAGYAYGSIDPTFEKTSTPYLIENRTFEQIIVKHKVNNFNLSHRFRLEQRFLEYATEYKLKNRIRYRFKGSFPINKKISVSIYDEIHYHLVNGFDFHQNRAYAGLGFLINKNLNLQLGYARHSFKDISYNRLSLQLNLKFDFRKEKI